MAVGASVIGNLVATFVFPRTSACRKPKTFGMVLFDLLQLAFLLFLTGGLNNPFACCMLGPVTISATALSLRSTIVIVRSPRLFWCRCWRVFTCPCATQQGGSAHPRICSSLATGPPCHRDPVHQRLFAARDVRNPFDGRRAGRHANGLGPRTEADRSGRRGCRGRA